MDRLVRALLLTVALTAPGDGSAQGREERRVEGRVLETKLQICQLKPRGCAGSMILETECGGRRARLSVRVKLGVPIRHGDDYVSLGVLGGSLVKVVYATEKDSIVAQSIEVLEMGASP
jgi:hypothetical protein